MGFITYLMDVSMMLYVIEAAYVFTWGLVYLYFDQWHPVRNVCNV